MQDLQSKSLDELKTIAKQLGIKVGRSNESTLKAKITAMLYPDALDQASASGLERIEPEKRGVTVRHSTDPELLRAELAKRFPRLALTTDGDTWQIKLGVAEDSGPLAMPIGVILKKASFINDARLPPKFKGTGTDLDGALA